MSPHTEPRPRSHHYNQAEWELQRPLITKLYVDLGKPVKDVIKALADQNFHVKYVQLDRCPKIGY